MTFKQLEYFAAVARTLSFTEAAGAVFVSQPALSRGISALEDELGVQLLARNHHSVSLTPAGTLLASELPNLRRELERVILLVRQTENGLMGHLRIGVLEGQQLDEAVQVTFKYFSQSLPLVELSPLRMEGEELVSGLMQDQLDVVFAMDFSLSENPDVEVLQLDTVPFCMVVPADHRLANRASCSISEFQQDSILVDRSQRATGEAAFLSACCEKAGFQPTLKPVVDNRTRLLWIESGFGVSLFNAANRACLSSSVRAIQLEDMPSAKQELAWKRDCRNSSVRIFTHLAECCL
jgi:DNA-binding transcriptional LysR family regulator